MATGIKITLQADMSLLMQANNETRSDLAHALKDSWNRAESDFIEMVRGQYIAKASPNKDYGYSLEFLNPVDIYALTEMPMLADNCRDDDDALRVYGPVWGFPDYMIRCHLRELANTGRVVFPMVTDFGDGVTFPSRHGTGTGTGAARAKKSAAAEHLARRVYENCNGGRYVIEQVPDIHGEPGDTIGRVVDFAMPPPPPTVGDLFAS